MRITAWRWAVAIGMAGALAGCGTTGPSPTQPNNGSMTATIDGGSFSAVAIAAAYSGGIMGLGGTDSQGRTIGIGGQITAPGTYPIGPTSSANFSLTIGSASWQAAITVGSGTLTVTSISATGAKGTFQFIAGPVPGTTSSGNRNVTQGAFDVTF